MNLTLKLSIAGAVGAIVAWLVSEPFARTAAVNGTHVGTMYFTLGSFFGWFAHAMLGALIVGCISVTFNMERARPLWVLLMGLLGIGLGGVLGWIADSSSDRLMISILKKSDSGQLHLGASAFWNFAVALALALGVAICSYPTVARFARVMLGGLAAGFLGFIARMVLEPVTLIVSMINAGPNSGGPQVWRPFDFSRLADDVVMGVVLGLSIGLLEGLMTSGTLRLVLGRNEGRNYRLGSGANRIGSAEGVEVPIFDMAVAPVHALVTSRSGQFFLENVSSHGGTLLNGQPVGQAPLRQGDAIQIASYQLVFMTHRQAGPSPTPYGGFVPPASNPETPPLVVMPISAPPVQASLILQDSMGTKHPLKPGTTVVGRDPGVGIALSWEPTVSRRHAEISVGPTGCSVVDLGSSNGTFVNGTAITGRQALNPGDELQLGKCVLKLGT